MLEFENFCGVFHFLRKLSDHSLTLLWTHALLFCAFGLLVGFGSCGDFDDVADILNNGFRSDTVFSVVIHLQLAAAFGLHDSVFHGLCYRVCVHYDLSVCVTGCASYGLDKRAFRTEEALLVRVQYRYKRHLGNIKSFAEQVDSHKHVELSQAQVADNFHTLDSVDVIMQIPDLYFHFFEVRR